MKSSARGLRSPFDGQRHPELDGAVGKLELCRENPDDFVRDSVEDDFPSNDVGVRAEAPLPEAVTEDDDAGLAGRGFLGPKGAADDGRDAENIEKRRGNRTGRQAYRLTGS